MMRINQTNSDLFYSLCYLFSLIFVLAFAGIFINLLVGSMPSIEKFGWSFLSIKNWNPVTSEFGALGCIVGTLTSSFIALSLSIPLSFGIVIYIKKIAPFHLQKYLRMLIDLLAGIPSIIFGMWGLFALAPIIGQKVQPWFSEHFTVLPLFEGAPFGLGLFTAGVVLAIMIIPYISSIVYEVFEMVPHILEESAYALGSTTWETVIHIIIPYGKKSIIGGIMLGLGRAMGETMAISFVIGNAHSLTTSLFNPSNSITSTLANEFNEAHGEIYKSSLIELGMILFLLTTCVVFISQLFIKISTRYTQRKAIKNAFA